MGRSLNKIISVLIFILFIVINNITSYAYDAELRAAGEDDPKNVACWKQTNTGYSSVPVEANNYILTGNNTLGSMGCGYFAVSYMLVKCGEENPNNGFTPCIFANNVIKNGYYQSNLYSDVVYPYVDFPHINSLYPNLKCISNHISTINIPIEQSLALVKEKYEEGYFVVMSVRCNSTDGHYIFCDGFTEDGEMVIGDSGFKGTKWSDLYEHDNTVIKSVSVFEHSNKKSYDCPSIYSDIQLSSSSTMTDSEKKAYQTLVDEWELVGMPMMTTYEINQQVIYFFNDSNLTISERENIANIKDSISSTKRSLLGWFSVISKFIAIVLLTYSSLLIMATVFDNINVWIDTSMVKVLTFGRSEILKGDLDKKEKDKGVLTNKQMAIRIVVLFLIGIILLSGIIIKIYVRVSSLIGS